MDEGAEHWEGGGTGIAGGVPPCSDALRTLSTAAQGHPPMGEGCWGAFPARGLQLESRRSCMSILFKHISSAPFPITCGTGDGCSVHFLSTSAAQEQRAGAAPRPTALGALVLPPTCPSAASLLFLAGCSTRFVLLAAGES